MDKLPCADHTTTGARLRLHEILGLTRYIRQEVGVGLQEWERC